MASEVVVSPVRSRRDRRAFLRLPWAIYRDDPNWVPPLLSELRRRFNPRRHPFFHHGEAEFYLARREGRPVGRIVAILNRAHNDFHEERLGFFGFFECEKSPETAEALMSRVHHWCRERNLVAVRGPACYSTNEECGLLVEGFDSPPFIMMPHHPAYYQELLTAIGYAKVKDLYAWLVSADVFDWARLGRLSERLCRRESMQFRTIDVSRWDEELENIRVIFNDAWEKNWGFVPMSREEFDAEAKQLKPVLDPRILILAEVEQQPAGFVLGLPDYNQALKKLNGRLFPFGLLRFLRERRKIDRMRVITLGVKKACRKRGIDAVLIWEVSSRAMEAGYPTAELSWVLEDNDMMNRAAAALGARRHKLYRMLERPLT